MNPKHNELVKVLLFITDKKGFSTLLNRDSFLMDYWLETGKAAIDPEQ